MKKASITIRLIGLLTILLFSQLTVFSATSTKTAALLPPPEICDNGIDDDGDGAIDLNDDDCDCDLVSTSPNLLPNPSFEEYENNEDCNSPLPSGLPTATNQANCLADWSQVTFGTTDAWNQLSLSGSVANFPDSIPTGIPSGFGVAGFWVGVSFANDRFREYIGSCLPDGGLSAGEAYTFSFSLGFATLKNFDEFIISSPGPIEIAIYGNTDCADLFVETETCLEGQQGWQELGTVLVSGEPNSWSTAEITFTPTQDILAIAIGGSCAPDLEPNVPFFDYGNYYFLDDVLLNTTEIVEQPVIGNIAILSGSPCEENLVLTAQTQDNSFTYQWYLEGIAISGATDPTYAVPPGVTNLGNYQVVLDDGLNCGQSPNLLVMLPEVGINLPEPDQSLCDLLGFGIEVFLGFGDTEYSWTYEGVTSNEPFLIITEPGTYFFTATRECVTVFDTLVISPNTPLNLDVSPLVPLCEGDLTTINASTDSPANFELFETNGTLLQSSATGNFELDIAETTSLQLVASDFCNSETETIVITIAPPIEIAPPVITPPSCGLSNGRIAVTVSNGNDSDYGFGWINDQNMPFSGSPIVTNLASGTYTVFIASVITGCQESFSFTLEEEGVLVSIDTQDPSCSDVSDGSLQAMVNSGIPPFLYRWSDSAGNLLGTDPSLSALAPGTYNIEVTDATDCSTSLEVILSAPSSIVLNPEVINISCTDFLSGQILAQAIGGTPPLLYALDNNPLQANSNFTDLSAGSYNLLVEDANGCQSTAENLTITEPQPITISLGDDLNAALGDLLTITPNVFPLDDITYQWASTDSLTCDTCQTLSLVAIQNATYRLTVSNPSGCVASDEVQLLVSKQRDIYIPNIFSPNNDGLNDNFQVFPGKSVDRTLPIKIFDRWGNFIFEGDAQQGWDGTYRSQLATSGTYVYSIEVVFLDGERAVLQGDVVLLR